MFGDPPIPVPPPAPKPAPVVGPTFWSKVKTALIWAWVHVLHPVLVALGTAIAWVATTLYKQFQPVPVSVVGFATTKEIDRSLGASSIVGVGTFIVFFVFHFALYLLPLAIQNGFAAAIPAFAITLVLSLLKRLNHGVDPAADISIFREPKPSS